MTTLRGSLTKDNRDSLLQTPATTDTVFTNVLLASLTPGDFRTLSHSLLTLDYGFSNQRAGGSEASHRTPPLRSSSLFKPLTYVGEATAKPLPTYMDAALAKIQQQRLQLQRSPSRRGRSYVGICLAVVCTDLSRIPVSRALTWASRQQ